MRKIPTLFEREFENHKVVAIKPIEEVLSLNSNII